MSDREPDPGSRSGSGSAADPGAAADQAPARVRWVGKALLLALLLGGGFLLAWRPLRPAFLVPEWMWWFFTGGHGEAFFATSVVLASGIALDAADLLLARRLRPLAYLLVLATIAALAALALWSYQHGHPLVALVAVLMATVGPIARRVFPGLPRAKARYRKPPPSSPPPPPPP